jgi:hypothetical protein
MARAVTAPVAATRAVRGVRSPIAEAAAIAILVFTVYVAATPRTSTAYRHFVYMASAFLHGHVDLRGVPEYYHDVIHVGGRVYAPFPPVPALLLMPVVAWQGDRTDQGRIGQILAATAVAVFVVGLRRLEFPLAVRLFCGAALAFGSVLWPATAIGTTWFFAQVVVVLATAVIVWDLAGEARPVVLGIAIVAAWLTRLNLVAAVPVLAVLIWRRHNTLRSVAGFALVNAAGLAIYLGYNYMRFGSPLQGGYILLSMAPVNAEAASRWGFFNVRFIPEQLYAMFLRMPEFIRRPPFLKPSPWGMSLLLTSPVVLRLFFPQTGRRGWLPWTVLVLSLAVPMLPYFSVGWVQFGYRYSLDWWVFVLVLLAYSIGGRPRAADYALMAASVAMNGLGVYWVRALGW